MQRHGWTFGVDLRRSGSVRPDQRSPLIGRPDRGPWPPLRSRPCRPPGSRTRELDVVILGATGFTGELTAAYLAEHAPAGPALGAGRAQPGASSRRCASGWRRSTRRSPTCRCSRPTAPTTPRCERSPSRTRVVITTVGPYLQYGEPLVAACAERRHRLRRPHRRAGVRRPDVPRAPRRRPSPAARGSCTPAASTRSRTTSAPASPSSSWPRSEPITLRGVVRAGGDRLRRHLPLGDGRDQPGPADARRRCSARRKESTGPEGRTSRAVAGKPHRDKRARLLAAAAADDRPVRGRRGRVLRSRRTAPTSATATTPALKTLRYTVGGALGAGRRLAVAAQIPPLRNFLQSRIKQGEGPRRGAPREVLVHRRLRRGERRADACTPGSAAATPATPRPRRCSPSPRSAWRSTTTRRPPAGHHRPRDGREPAGPPADGRDQVRDPLTSVMTELPQGAPAIRSSRTPRQVSHSQGRFDGRAS